ncbi:MAG: NACHT domain-containing protein [Leptolyngbya sp. UWPOB_LEPTO1]|uniref:NACHT C-terminal helical domain 2-containing protein n=1 Tax=Leptolyngbya sp. UWPOB_LEPTO1 TaxID=2815653 RepID=UPI001AD21464|nr:NACHT domain-containing protein [Leptolyngbya sp. UWPOB_LEPTO1]MBN8563964.1 NACHT domain-containing protein [Leptolyngbya sp. UWPOB_LEPTO1]
MQPIEIFISYAREDELLMKELEKHLSNLKNQGIIRGWHNQQIPAGAKWAEQIDHYLESAQIILLLISPDFLASRKCYEVELRRAMERHKAKEVIVIPVLLRPVDWQGAPFSKLQALPQNEKPINTWENQDEAFQNVVTGIRYAITFPHSDVNEIVQEVRQKISRDIQKRCGTMRVLDMEQPITINSIYTTVNILEKLTGNRRRSIEQLLEGFNSEDFDRFSFGRIQQKRIPGLAAVQKHDKLLILGKPGAGKTTFLKWLALQCQAGHLYENRVPIFVTLKEFAETAGRPNLTKFIARQFTECGIEKAEVVTQILLEGRSLILLDGLDEVRAEDQNHILKTIQQTSRQFDGNQFVMTCRIAAKEYTFEKFTEVEVADFDTEQIADFAFKWFQHKDPTKATEFPKALGAHPGLQELATNPLLLTLLCLVYEEQAGFPANRAELYKEGLDVLLKKWDGKRNITRDVVYKQLSFNRKEDLLSQIAFNAFMRSEYFFKQRFVEMEIQDYIRNLPDANLDPEALQLDSEAVLKSIQAQHGLLVERARGIYSFSHLTFQEYFTARQIEKSDGDFTNIVCHIIEKRWREVFLLTVGMLRNADKLLLAMKQEIDSLLLKDEKLQQFLDSVAQKSCSAKALYKLNAVRAFYFEYALGFNRKQGYVLNREHSLACALDDAIAKLDRILSFDRRLYNLNHALDDDRALARVIVLSLARDSDLDRDFQQRLQRLKEEIPSVNNPEKYKQWWKTNGSTWTKQLRIIMLQHFNIGHDWQFTDVQKDLLQEYHNANRLLVACLSSDCYVSRKVREEIEATLLLPYNRSGSST